MFASNVFLVQSIVGIFRTVISSTIEKMQKERFPGGWQSVIYYGSIFKAPSPSRRVNIAMLHKNCVSFSAPQGDLREWYPKQDEYVLKRDWLPKKVRQRFLLLPTLEMSHPGGKS